MPLPERDEDCIKDKQYLLEVLVCVNKIVFNSLKKTKTKQKHFVTELELVDCNFCGLLIKDTLFWFLNSVISEVLKYKYQNIELFSGVNRKKTFILLH